MKRLATVALSVSAVGLMACGPGAKIGGGKQGAAEALAAASMPTKASTERSATPVDLTSALTWKCPEGGEAALTGFSVNISGTNVGQAFTITYKGCGLATSSAGTAVYNGSLTISQQVTTSTGGASIVQSLKGRVLVQGAFDDFLEADVTQSVTAGALGGTGSVSMTLKGTAATSSGSYTFDGEVTVTARTITADLSRK